MVNDNSYQHEIYWENNRSNGGHHIWYKPLGKEWQKNGLANFIEDIWKTLFSTLSESDMKPINADNFLANIGFIICGSQTDSSPRKHWKGINGKHSQWSKFSSKEYLCKLKISLSIDLTRGNKREHRHSYKCYQQWEILTTKMLTEIIKKS